MKPFRSREEMLDAHELMFGHAGRQCAEIVLHWAITLFAAPLDVLNIRVVLPASIKARNVSGQCVASTSVSVPLRVRGPVGQDDCGNSTPRYFGQASAIAAYQPRSR